MLLALVIYQLRVKDSNKRIWVGLYKLLYFTLIVTKFLDNHVHNFLIKFRFTLCCIVFNPGVDFKTILFLLDDFIWKSRKPTSRNCRKARYCWMIRHKRSVPLLLSISRLTWNSTRIFFFFLLVSVILWWIWLLHKLSGIVLLICMTSSYFPIILCFFRSRVFMDLYSYKIVNNIEVIVNHIATWHYVLLVNQRGRMLQAFWRRQTLSATWWLNSLLIY